MVVALLYISEGSLGFIEFDDAPTIMITQKMICFTLIKIHNCKIRIIEGFFINVVHVIKINCLIF